MSRLGGARPIGLIFAFAALLMPVIPVIKGLGLAPLAAVCGVAGLIVLWRGTTGPDDRVEPNRTLTVLILALCLWALISSFWSMDVVTGVKQALRLTGVMLLGYVLLRLAKTASSEDRKLCAKVLVASFFTITSLLLVEISLDGPFSVRWFHNVNPAAGGGYYWFNSAGSILAILAWPTALFALRMGKRYLVGLALGAGAVANYMIDSKSALLAFVVGLLVAGLVYAWKAKATRLIAVVLAASVLLSPLIPLKVLQPGTVGLIGDSRPMALLHRVYIWDFAAQRILDKPFFGWGMGGSRTVPGGRDFIADKRFDGRAMPLHPHNTSLQLWMELGVVGAALGAAILFALFRVLGAATDNRQTLALWSGQATTIITVAHLSFGAWQNWWVSAVFLSAAFAVMAGRENDTPDQTPEQTPDRGTTGSNADQP